MNVGVIIKCICRPSLQYAAPSYTPYCCLLHRNRNKQVLRSSVLLHHSCSILQHRAQLLHNNLVTPAFYTEAPKYYSPPSYYTEAYTSYAKPDNYTNAPQNYATAFYYTTKARSTTVLRRPSTTPLPMLLQRTTLKFQSTIDGPKDFNWHFASKSKAMKIGKPEAMSQLPEIPLDIILLDTK
ncbi:uncharacterized protein LOC123474283 isoform X1 [Daphnia magna]|uniref:uncharacterized protein LOC123474283 isoform X1 n=1 Tax=Daphnia magna TaxID=35525 RepID=UPI001E1BD586|nr:uncharacterized protein LOC123474283 isoform X1 [Daphnia magna]